MEYDMVHRDHLALYSKLFEENPCVTQNDHDFPMGFSSSSRVNKIDQLADEGSISSLTPSSDIYTHFYDPFDPFQGSFGMLNQEFSNAHLVSTPFVQSGGIQNHIHDQGSRFSFQALDRYQINETLDMSSAGVKELENESYMIFDDIARGEMNNNKKKFTSSNSTLQKRRKRIIDKKSEIIKGQWTPDEDRLLVELVEKNGVRKWSSIAQMLSGRIGKQCRERWHNHLKPNIKKDRWSEEEDKILIEAHKQLGNKWAEIARSLPGRSENTIKNHWNATKRKQLSARKSNISKPISLLQNYIKSVISISDEKEACLENLSSSSSTSTLPSASNDVIKKEEITEHESFKLPPLDAQINMQFDLQKEMDFMHMLSCGYI